MRTLLGQCSRFRPDRAAHITGAALWAAGRALVLVGVLLPYSKDLSDGGADLSILDFSHVDTTWAFALSFLAAAAAVPLVATLGRRNPSLVGGFVCGVGLVVFLDFLGAYVIGPSTYGSEGYDALKLGAVVGAIGALLIVGGGAALATARGGAAPMPAQPRTDRRRLPATLRWILIAAVSAHAVVGILTLALGDFSWDGSTADKLLGSSLSIASAALLVVAGAAAYVRGRLGQLPAVGAVVTVAGFTWVLIDLWALWDSDQPWKGAWTLVIVALACAYASLVALARNGPPHPVGVAALVCAAAFAAVDVAGIWTEASGGGFWRLFGALSLLLAATTVVMVLLGRGDQAPSGAVAEVA
jgi:hypothetical protein